MSDRWSREDPPPEAYERVTNPERFRPLHGFAERLLGELEAEFDAAREEGSALDGEIDRDGGPTVRLVPRAADAGAIAIGFSSFPGLVVRVGHWTVEPIPICGCDACDETAEWGQRRLGGWVGDLTSGRFSESIELGPWGSGWLFEEFRGERVGGSRLTRKRARSMIAAAGGRRRFDYGPWPRRAPVAAANT